MGSVTDTIGLTDFGGAEDAADASAAATKASVAMTKEQLEFEKEKYADWEAIYGPLQEDLGTYFKNLTGEDFSAKQIQEIQSASQAAQRQIDTQLAQRGISGSGLEASLTSQNIFGTEMQKAGVRAGADQAVAEQQMGFLGLGLNQGTEMLSNIGQTSASGASSLMGFGSSALGASAQMSGASTGAMGTIAGFGVGGFMASDIRLKKNIELVDSIRGVNFYTWEWNKKANNLGLVGSSFGVIAQEVQDIIANVVTEKDGYLIVNYNLVLDYVKDN